MRFTSVRNVHTEAKHVLSDASREMRCWRIRAPYVYIEPRLHTVDAWSKTMQPARRIAYIRISKNAQTRAIIAASSSLPPCMRKERRLEHFLAALIPELVDTDGGLTPAIIDYLAVVVGVIGGATFACNRKLDIIGVVSLGLITGFGGGILRDMLLQDQGVYFTQHPYLVLASIVVCVLAFYFRRIFRNLEPAVFLLDTLSVGLFAAAGASKALGCDSGPVVSFILGAVTAVGGGALRDVFVGEVPAIFKAGSFYGMAGVAGSFSFVLLASMNDFIALAVCVVLTTALRYASIWFNWSTSDDPRDLTDYLARGGHALRGLYHRGRLPRPTRRIERRDRRHSRDAECDCDRKTD